MPPYGELPERNLNYKKLSLMLNVLYAGCSGLSLVILVQFALKLHVTAKNCQKVHKTLF